ncbi:class I SAM-dependent methyltransferase [Haloarchaeobius iranensis]|uniref:Methyltransferase domain-containing protein n=1 Tax=Haloarchaeobius iranensis TaxID=996166 RepID=A0A1H0AR68_9EURY|nr:class I SAM-dependent methyltransferase [Haloarchaeobius iranensis]SDN35881.1 Methyltransferase domain-containing protein [Haloarchaeobius iranensis]
MPFDDSTASDAYDELADGYAEEVRSNAYNAHLEFPATSSMIPEVDGQRVLDAGCGTGVYTEFLLDDGADVVGLDASEAMLAHARERVGDRAELHQADLGERLPFDDDAFDGVVSALALGYVEDWDALFAEFARVLRPGGFVVFSTGHPLDQFPLDEAGEPVDAENYFEVERLTKEWDVPVPYYRRPFSAVVNPLLESGFRLETVVEPQPTEGFREQLPERYEKESRYPVFLCVRARLD